MLFALLSPALALPVPRQDNLDDQEPIMRPPNGGLGDNPQSGNFSIASLFIYISIVSLVFLFVCLTFVLVYRYRVHRNEDDLTREEDNQAYMELNLDEQELFFQSKDYLSQNPYIRDDLTLSQNLTIQEKGIRAWEFMKDIMLSNNDLLIINRCELNFFKKFECSAQTNLPVPMKNEVYYFESKIYSLPDPENTIISIGLGVKPYPWFRLPGRHAHSVCYDSSGYRRHNQPFSIEGENPFPKLIQGDVVGVGYRVRNGTIFFTRNGKKVSELKIGGHIKNFKIPHKGQIYPIVGANNLCSVHVNLGQMGYVFIEGNVKKWGFAPLEGNGPAPPAYNKFNSDILLERSEIDDDDILERESDFPPDFWDVQEDEEDRFSQDKFSYNAYSDVNSTDERITLNSLAPPIRPPSYEGEEDENEDVDENEEDEEEVGDEDEGEEEAGEIEQEGNNEGDGENEGDDVDGDAHEGRPPESTSQEQGPDSRED